MMFDLQLYFREHIVYLVGMLVAVNWLRLQRCCSSLPVYILKECARASGVPTGSELPEEAARKHDVRRATKECT